MGDIKYEDLPEGMEGGAENYPLTEVAAAAELVVAGGGIVYQKYTCSKCGNRLTMDVPNKFYTRGECDQCMHITDIETDGCNFLAVFPQTEKGREVILGLHETPGN